jgi:hypothetical protein
MTNQLETGYPGARAPPLLGTSFSQPPGNATMRCSPCWRLVGECCSGSRSLVGRARGGALVQALAGRLKTPVI